MAHCKKNYISRFQQWYFICTFIVPLYWGIRCWNEIDKHSKTKHDFKAKTFNQKMNQLIRITFSQKKIPNILVLFFSKYLTLIYLFYIYTFCWMETRARHKEWYSSNSTLVECLVETSSFIQSPFMQMVCTVFSVTLMSYNNVISFYIDLKGIFMAHSSTKQQLYQIWLQSIKKLWKRHKFAQSNR